jgi:hypothetical protein
MRIYIQQPITSGYDAAKIYLLEEEGKNRYAINLDADGRLVQTLLEDGVAPILKPFLELPSNVFDKFVKAVTDYASDNNIKTESETLLQGKLKATEKHLEDLRGHFTKVLDKVLAV